MMNSRGFSPSSFFSEEVCLSDEKQVGVKKMDQMSGYGAFKLDGTPRTEGVASSPHENRIPLESHAGNGFALPDYYLSRGRNANLSLGKHLIGADRAVSRSLPSAVDHDLGSRTNSNIQPVPYCFDGDKINLMGAQYENGLFSSSMSDLFSRNLKLSSNNGPYGHSFAAAAAASHYEEDEVFESLEELEAQTIGNLLPDDDDLLSGVTDGFGSVIRSNNVEDVEDLDLFSSVGGLELGEDSFLQRNPDLSDLNSNNQLGISLGSNGGEHPFGEHPSRTLFVRNINSNVEDSELRTLFEQYGDIRTLYTACKHRGFVMISYYDIRAACNAMKALQNKPLRRRKLDIHFSIPKENPSEKDVNQGTLVIFNLDSSVSNDEIREIFGVYGEIKEIRDAPGMSSHKFVEFYDVRAAESALRALNRSDIAGKQIKLERGRLGGSQRFMQPFSSELEQEESGFLLQHSPSNNLSTGFSAGSLSLGGTLSGTDNGIHGPLSTNGGHIGPLLDNVLQHGVSSSVPNSLPSLVRVESGNQSSIAESGHLRNHPKFELQSQPNLHPHSLPEYHDGLANGPLFGSPSNIAANVNSRPPELIDGQFRRISPNGQSIELNEVFGSSGNGSCPPPGRHYMWSNSHHPQQPQAVLWPNSPSFVNGIGASHPSQMHAVPRAPSHMMNPLLPLNSHHVGSAPSVNPSLWDRRNAYAGESPDAASVFHPGSLGNMRISGNSPHPLEFVPHNIFPRPAGNCMDVQMPSKNIGLHPHHQRCMIFPARGQMLPMMSSFDSPNERTRTRRNDCNSSQPDNKKQFELDLERIARGEDKRTTLMIKNIPNKYTSKMLLAAIDERHRGTYDFIYLPIDFKNKCNVGYAFINMTDPALIVHFYQTFNGKKWEKFNSEKVASLAYARIQGKAALIAHFQNSSLMNEDKRCRPILFHTDGPNAGDQVPFPMGPNIRPRPGKTRTSASEDNNQEIPSNPFNGEDYSNGDSSSGSGKESD
ncbi:protein MEI2-like 4 isoform X1 [Salvia miltiorrhiza]|uniref:protein MEI2-like 4 isoform X1 n=1 Tax=Salvia miltiorrhiza TaxID=226208 RepID=UPI0025AC49AE|nr:protein MEI2-like 4 isoform X1 [Salvia miltiorrhiza]XP_057773884.1 protein MEI2-like 4 isoform X1 [Salvia miltiorrhiza]XP_057773885.1 protein MEI2-like 4 isoform X1 [Salvia miltiorrhiza]XP_057773886.1 protein MEI2-like 4 isoform X1 [Salvia miltiorrhiza]